MLFAHIADTHLGYRQYNLDEREEDFYRSFREAVDRIIDEGCRFVVHSGDLFDEPRPHVKALVVVREELERLREEGIKFYCIAGNHDLLMRSGAVPPHRLYPEMEFLTPKKPARVHGDVLIAGLPYFSKLHSRVLLERLAELEKLAERHRRSVLLLHQGIDRYLGVGYELRMNELPAGFSYYALGHVHKPLLDSYAGGIVAYPGSTEVWRGDEIEVYEKMGKGFYLADTEAKEPEEVEWVKLKSVRRFVKLRVSSEEELEALPEPGDGKPVVRLELQCRTESFQRLYSEVMRRLADRVLYVDVRRLSQEEERRASPAKGLDVYELLGSYLRERSEAERSFAAELLRLLEDGRTEDAVKVAEEFFSRRWGGGR